MTRLKFDRRNFIVTLSEIKICLLWLWLLHVEAEVQNSTYQKPALSANSGRAEQKAFLRLQPRHVEIYLISRSFSLHVHHRLSYH